MPAHCQRSLWPCPAGRGYAPEKQAQRADFGAIAKAGKIRVE
jgi:hypothetical protein